MTGQSSTANRRLTDVSYRHVTYENLRSRLFSSCSCTRFAVVYLVIERIGTTARVAKNSFSLLLSENQTVLEQQNDVPVKAKCENVATFPETNRVARNIILFLKQLTGTYVTIYFLVFLNRPRILSISRPDPGIF